MNMRGYSEAAESAWEDRVAPDGYDWGGYNYCDTAIARDRSNGFTVTELTRPTEGAQP